jgi:hypothetical protein
MGNFYYFTVYAANASGQSVVATSPIVEYYPNPYNLTLALTSSNATMSWSATGTSPTFYYTLYSNTSYSYTGKTSVTSNSTGSTSVVYSFTPTSGNFYFYEVYEMTSFGPSLTYQSPIVEYLTTPIIPSGTRSFTYTGTNQSYTVPSGMTSIAVSLWGAGGGGGGVGAYISGNMPVTPADVLTIVVGNGGQYNALSAFGGGGASANGSSGGGGGASYISNQTTTLLACAGGGGGGSYNFYASGSGACATWSGTANQGSYSTGYSTYAGTGGTQVAGGSNAQTANSAQTGGYLQGGTGGYYSGGGGGGYYGGGGGTEGGGGTPAGTGGGGSSYTALLTNASGSNGTVGSPPGTSVTGYVSGVAGSTSNAVQGGPGLVIFALPLTLGLTCSGGSASMTWTSVTGATNYSWVLYKSSTNGYYGTLVTNSSTATLSASASGLTTGYYYYFTIVATTPSGPTIVAASSIVAY